VEVDRGVRATSRTGYDNQPHFLPGGRTLLFTSIDEAGNADIHTFDLMTRELGTLTDTHPESEYSATYMPSGGEISLIRVEADSAQRLWSFGLSGKAPRVLLPEIAPVGYHAWIDEERLALFVLGDPATLQVASLSEGRGQIMAEDIGRSLYRIPGQDRVSFVQWMEGGQGRIMALNPDTGETHALGPLLEGNEFYAWTPSGHLVMGQGSVLFIRDPAVEEGWKELADLAPAGVDGISRIAISPEGDRIAVVGVAG
jgi:dipeptidyl aminopeptidase/acylaminoacyl peptidase